MDYLLLEDIAKYFPTPEDAEAAWNLFDKDGNGDATRDEVEMTCMCVVGFPHFLIFISFGTQRTRGELTRYPDRQCHREQLSIEHSMRDLDSAVGRLDNIFMSLYGIVAILIIAVALVSTTACSLTYSSLMVPIGGSITHPHHWSGDHYPWYVIPSRPE